MPGRLTTEEASAVLQESIPDIPEHHDIFLDGAILTFMIMLAMRPTFRNAAFMRLVGTSGEIRELQTGYSLGGMMTGNCSEPHSERAQENGWAHAGKHDIGHFRKMIHNAME
jgi:6-phosphogluconate dehydrogenase (decarboxylating)